MHLLKNYKLLVTQTIIIPAETFQQVEKLNQNLTEKSQPSLNLLVKCFYICTTPRTARISGLNILTLEITIFGLKMMVKSGLEFFILKFY